MSTVTDKKIFAICFSILFLNRIDFSPAKFKKCVVFTYTQVPFYVLRVYRPVRLLSNGIF